jgi:hypothetical protein
MDWCVSDFARANHPPAARIRGEVIRAVRPGQAVTLDGAGSTDPDGQPLRLTWTFYPEPGTYRGEPPQLTETAPGTVTFAAPRLTSKAELHFLLTATDNGSPALARYRRVIVKVEPRN